jgi:hypothetical protein
MNRLVRFAQALGVNAIPLGGFFAAGWSPATTLAVYWCENVLGSLLIAARIALHWRMTGKRGHYQARLDQGSGSTARVGGRMGQRAAAGRGGDASAARRAAAARPVPRPGDTPTFLTGFALVAFVFSFAQAIFLAFILWAILRLPVEREALENGVIGIAVMLSIGFLADLRGLRHWPFAALKEIAGLALGRVVLVHLSIIGGMALLAWWGEPRSFFGVFLVLKLLADLGSLLPRMDANLEKPPGWLGWTMSWFGDRADFESYWSESHARERAEAAEDEQVWDASRGGWCAAGSGDFVEQSGGR